MAILAHWLHDLQNTMGDLLAGTSVSVRIERESDAGLPVVYDGRDSGTASSVGNPFTVTNGMADVYVAAGNYKVTISAFGYSPRVLRNVQIGIYSDPASAIAASGVSLSPKTGLSATTVQAALQELSNRNALINGAMMIAQRGTTIDSTTTFPNTDDRFTLDRWNLLSDGNDIVDVTRDASVVPTNGLCAMRLDVETADKKFGIVQFVEQRNCIGLIGETVTLSFKARVAGSGKLDNLKAAIVAWDGTADTLTSDIVSAWGSEGTNPTLVSNWTYENTPVNLNPTTSYQTFSVSALVDTASAKNIAVFIWSDVDDTDVGDFLYITDVQLEVGAAATPFERRPFSIEAQLCQRYMRKSYAFDTAPGTITTTGQLFRKTETTSSFHFLERTVFNPPMFGTPTVTLRNPNDGGTTNPIRTNSPSDIPGSVLASSDGGFTVEVNSSSVAANVNLTTHFTAVAEM